MKLQQLAEEKVGFLIVFTLIVVSVGLMVEVVPLFGTKEVITATKGVKPYSPLQVATGIILWRANRCTTTRSNGAQNAQVLIWRA